MSSYHVPDPRTSNPGFNQANAIALPIFAALSSFFIIFPFRAFWLLRNFPSCSICVTLWLVNLGTFINAIVWNTDDWTIWWAGYGYCDIVSALRWPLTLSASTGLCCFIKGLANALNTDATIINPTKAQRRRHLLGEILLVWGPPALMICLQYIIQAGRFAIVPVFGCTAENDNSWPYILIVVMWGPFFTCITSAYAVILLYRLRKHRKTIAQALSNTGSGMVPRKFIKLAMLAIVILVVYLPVQILFIFRAFPSYWVPYSWARVHDPKYWGTISFYHTEDVPLLQYSGWATISYGFLMLPFYGFNDDAIDAYRHWLVFIGFGYFWPSLKEPYRPRGRGGSSNGSNRSRSSEPGRFDLVSRCMRYFDIQSQVTSVSTGRSRADSRGSRKGSQTQSVTTYNDSSTIGKTTSISTTSPLSKEKYPATPTSSERPNNNHFATIRIFNPFAWLSSLSSSKKASPLCGTDDGTVVLEKNPTPATPDTAFDKDLEAGKNTISTNIWSPGADSHHDDLQIDNYPDPLSPVLGSRAYRERERREMEREVKDRKELKKTVGELGLEGGQASSSGVVVQKTLEMKEEDAGKF